MNGRTFIAEFTGEEAVLAATRSAREAGLEVEDVYTPWPIHGIREAMGLPRSRIPWACLAGALFGGGFALWFQHWSSAVSFPIDVGGKPFSSIPAFIPITFEMTILGGAFGALFALLIRTGLRPGAPVRSCHPPATDDRFVLVARPTGAVPSPGAIHALFTAHGAVETRETPPTSEVGARSRSCARRRNLVLAMVVVLLAALHVQLRPAASERGFLVLPDMADAVAAESFDESLVRPGEPVIQAAPDGAVARGLLPERYVKTPEDAERAGRELVNPYAADDEAALARGRTVFTNTCTACHGPGGLGDGEVAKRGFPPPPSLLAENALKMPDGRMYHVITAGQVNMPAHAGLVSREDRWKVVLYIRSLQAGVAR